MCENLALTCRERERERESARERERKKREEERVWESPVTAATLSR